MRPRCRRATAGVLGTPCSVDREHPIVGAPTLFRTNWSSLMTTNYGVNVDIALTIASSQGPPSSPPLGY